MADMDSNLGAILGNPEMMQKIMGLAQSMGSQEAKQENAPPPQAPPIDGALLQAVAGMAKQSGVDRDQQALLRALGPYLSRQRIQKLENAMRAARMARMAATVLSRQDFKLQSSR